MSSLHVVYEIRELVKSIGGDGFVAVGQVEDLDSQKHKKEDKLN